MVLLWLLVGVVGIRESGDWGKEVMTKVSGVVLPCGHFTDVGNLKVTVFVRLLVFCSNGYDHCGDLFVDFFCCCCVGLRQVDVPLYECS